MSRHQFTFLLHLLRMTGGCEIHLCDSIECNITSEACTLVDNRDATRRLTGRKSRMKGINMRHMSIFF